MDTKLDLTFPEIDADALPENPRFALLSLRKFVEENPGIAIIYSRVCETLSEYRGKETPIISLKRWLMAAGVDINQLPTSKARHLKGGTPIELIGKNASETKEYRTQYQREYKRAAYRALIKKNTGREVKSRIPDPIRD